MAKRLSDKNKSELLNEIDLLKAENNLLKTEIKSLINAKDNTAEYADLHAIPIPLETQQLVAALRDSAKTIRRQSELVSVLLDNLNIGIFMVEAPSGRPLISNKMARVLLGRGIMPSANKENLSEVYKARKKGTHSPYPPDEMPILLGMKGVSAHIEDMVIERPDGTELLLEVFGTPVIKENGDIWASLVSFHDITAKRKAEEALLESELKFSALFSSMTEMVALHEIVFNDSGQPVNYRILDCNPAYEIITGIKRQNAAGRLATEVYNSSEPPYFNEFLSVALSGVPFEYTTYYQPMNKHFSISVVSPKKNLFATITSDITEIVAIHNTLAEKNKELENYLYVASHDMRSPLVNIQGFSQRLQKIITNLKDLIKPGIYEARTEEIADICENAVPRTLEYIFTNVAKIDSLLSGLLQISRTGRIRMTVLKTDMNRLINSVIDSRKFQINEISAVVNFANLPECFGDEILLNQLFSNLIDNAISYRCADRQLKIDIDATATHGTVIYRISDNGIGIQEKYLGKIWDVFFRVNPSHSNGEGLGLSIVKRIADKHKGKVWAESQTDKGSTFFVELMTKEFNE